MADLFSILLAEWIKVFVCNYLNILWFLRNLSQILLNFQISLFVIFSYTNCSIKFVKVKIDCTVWIFPFLSLKNVSPKVFTCVLLLLSLHRQSFDLIPYIWDAWQPQRLLNLQCNENSSYLKTSQVYSKDAPFRNT
jgi:hypothetical protein